MNFTFILILRLFKNSLTFIFCVSSFIVGFWTRSLVSGFLGPDLFFLGVFINFFVDEREFFRSLGVKYRMVYKILTGTGIFLGVRYYARCFSDSIHPGAIWGIAKNDLL